MARPDEDLWNLFDSAQTGELQAAEARKLGMLVNPHYLQENVEDTREIAIAMELLPWLQEVHGSFGNIKIDSGTMREQFEGVADPDHINFFRGMGALKRTGLVHVTKVDESAVDLPPSTMYSISRRAVKADHREVIHPYQPSCSGCLGRTVLVGALGVGVAAAETVTFNGAITGVGERVAQGMVVVGTAMVSGAVLEKTIATVRAAQVYKSYRRGGQELTA